MSGISTDEDDGDGLQYITLLARYIILKFVQNAGESIDFGQHSSEYIYFAQHGRDDIL